MPLFGPAGERISYRLYPHKEQAPPLLLLHGFTASSAAFLSNIETLNTRFTVVTVDLLGHGESESPEEIEPYTPDRAVARIAGLMDELGMTQAVICGHSLGGALALRFALDHPSRVLGLVIINSNSAAGRPEWREETQPRMVEMAARLRAEGSGFIKRSRLYPAASNRLPDAAREALAKDFDAATPAGLAGTAQGLVARVNAFERINELRVPTLVIIGDRDRDFVRNAPGMVAQIRPEFARVVTIEDAGHAANLEQPRAFYDALFNFTREAGVLPKASSGSSSQRALVILGSVLLAGALALAVAATVIAFRGDPEGRAFVVPTPGAGSPTAAASRSPQAAATTPRSPTTNGGSVVVATVTPTATLTVGPGTPTPAPPTPQPPTPIPPTATAAGPTVTPGGPTATPGTPASTSTPTVAPASPTPTSPPATNTPVPTPTTAVRFNLRGPEGGGTTRSFGVDASPPPDRIEWSTSAGGSQVGPTIIVPMPPEGCVTVTATGFFFASGITRTASAQICAPGS